MHDDKRSRLPLRLPTGVNLKCQLATGDIIVMLRFEHGNNKTLSLLPRMMGQ